VQANPRSTTNVTTPSRRHQTIRGVLYALAPIAALVALLGAAAPASAAPSCARQVIDDWYDDGRVDRTYPLHCYDDAIEALPPDVRDYSSAKEDIQRALQARMRNEPAPPATTDPSSGGGTGTNPTKPPKNQTTTDASPKNENPPEASGEIDSDSASSVPIPLLVLAGLALLLIAGGSAGYFIRRYQGRNNPPPVV
jgi:cobalamin biosynthesis Mg chelatase CobN